MSYEKQNFKDGLTLFASQLNHIEDGIIALESLISKPTASIGEITLLAANWVTQSDSLHHQIVSVAGATANSQVDLTPTVEQLLVFYEKDLTLVTENENGIVTVYAIGQKPTNDYTIQVTITEVTV